MDERGPWPPPPPATPFRSATPGYSVVLPEEPPKRGKGIALVAASYVAVAALAVGAVWLLKQSDPVSARIDSVAVTTTSTTSTIAATTTTSTIPVEPGEVRFLRTKSSIVGTDYWIDLAGMPVGTCFVVVLYSRPDPTAEPTDCYSEHYYQLYAASEVPASVTDYVDVEAYWSDFCDEQFVAFIGVDYFESRFRTAGQIPSEWEFPRERTVTCYLYLPGEFAWIGDARGSKQ